MNKKLLTAAVGAAMTFAGTAHALEAKVYGQINRALMYADDGKQSELHNVDNINSSTRFGFVGSKELQPGIKAGIHWETEFASNPSSSVSQTARSNKPTLNERKLELYFNGGFGKVSLGQGDGAANGGMEVDLSKTAYAAAYSGTVSFVGGGIQFRNSTTGAVGPSIGSTISDLDFESRYDRLRYDSPKLGPVSIAVSTGEKTDTVNEVSLRLKSDLGGGSKLAGALGMSKEDTASAKGTQTTKGISLSWLAASGLVVTVAHANQTDEAVVKQDDTFNYLKVGYNFSNYGVSLDYGKGEDFAATGDKSTVKGIAWSYAPVKWADIYALVKVHSLDRSGSNFDNIRIIAIGSRIKF